MVPSAIDHQRGGKQGVIDDAFGAENNRDVCLRGGRRDGGPRAFEERRSGGGTDFPMPR